jgi:hypothetical protein
MKDRFIYYLSPIYSVIIKFRHSILTFCSWLFTYGEMVMLNGHERLQKTTNQIPPPQIFGEKNEKYEILIIRVILEQLLFCPDYS